MSIMPSNWNINDLVRLVSGMADMIYGAGKDKGRGEGVDEGKKEGYAKASDEYRKKLKEQAEHFTRKVEASIQLYCSQ